MLDKPTDVTSEFVEAVGLRFQEQQMPRIAGRIFGLLMLEGGPLSFAELAETLQVSRGSISTNARMLAEIGLIERVAKPGDRQDHYRIIPDGLGGIMHKQISKLRWTDAYYRSVADRLPTGRTEARKRLIAAATYSLKIAEGLERSLREAEEILAQELRDNASS